MCLIWELAVNEQPKPRKMCKHIFKLQFWQRFEWIGLDLSYLIWHCGSLPLSFIGFRETFGNMIYVLAHINKVSSNCVREWERNKLKSKVVGINTMNYEGLMNSPQTHNPNGFAFFFLLSGVPRICPQKNQVIGYITESIQCFWYHSVKGALTQNSLWQLIVIGQIFQEWLQR